MGRYIEIGTGLAQRTDSYEAGREAARMALTQIENFTPRIAFVFAGSQYDYPLMLKGIREVLGPEVPVVGCSTAGEINQGWREGTVTVTVWASPYLNVRVGIGTNLSEDYFNAFEEAVESTGLKKLFHSVEGVPPGYTTPLEYTRKSFVIVFLPGETGQKRFYNYNFIELLRKKTMNTLPLIGGCAGHSLYSEKTSLFYNEHVLTDAAILVLVESYLKFSVSLFHNFVPTEQRALVTKAREYIIEEINDQPAAPELARILGIPYEELEKRPIDHFSRNPFGLCDVYGNYHLFCGTRVTPEGWVECTRRVFSGLSLVVMKAAEQATIFDRFLSRAIRKGKIASPVHFMYFPCVFQKNFWPDREEKFLIPLHDEWRRVPATGFFTFGEVGVNDEGVPQLCNFSTSLLVLGDEFNDATQIAMNHQRLYDELSSVYELSNILSSTLNFNFIVNKAVEMAGRFLRADGCLLMLIENEDGQEVVRVLAAYGIADKRLLRNLEMKSTFPYHIAITQNKALISEMGESHYLSCHLSRLVQARSLLGVPLKLRGRVVGSVVAFHRQKNFFTQQDLEYLEMMAHHISAAVSNARLYREARDMYRRDGLTGLYEHNYFMRLLQRIMGQAECRGEKLSLLMIDLDNFRRIIDGYGLDLASRVLIATAEILKRNTGKKDLLCRYWSDGFFVLLRGADREKAVQVAEKIRGEIAALKITVRGEPISLGLTASIGVATFPDDARTPQHLIDRADRAMYRVKRALKNEVGVYVSEIQRLEKTLSNQERALLDTIKIMLQLLNFRDRYTWEHSCQVAEYAEKLARRIGLDEENIFWIKLAAYLHDVGKIHIQPEILNKAGALTDEEWEAIRLHPVVGANLLDSIQGLKRIVPVVYHHHERYDGRGYPTGLAREEIPLEARILTLADSFDAMMSNRPYRRCRTLSWAVEEIRRERGNQFDPYLADEFLELITRK